MRWIRLLIRLFISTFRTRLRINETSALTFTVWLTDIDASIMNNATMMTVFETGRIDYMVRTGFFKLARQQNWYVPASGISVQFFRPLKVLQKAELTTRLLHMTDQFIYIVQKITRKGKDIAICLVRSKVKSGKENIATAEILKLLNADPLPIESKEIDEFFNMQDETLKKNLSQWF